MPVPVIVAGAAAVAARLAAKKAAQQLVKKTVKGKIVKGSDVAKAVKKVNAKTAKVEAKANARGLKAAQKPTNRTGTMADRMQRAELQGQADIIKNASPARANRTRGGSLASMKAYGGYGVATLQRTPKGAARQADITKELNPVRTARRTRLGKPTKKK